MKAEVHMGRTHAGDGPDYMTLEMRIDYPETGVRLVKHRVELALADFSLALTGRGGIKGEYDRSVVPLRGEVSAARRLVQLESALACIKGVIESEQPYDDRLDKIADVINTLEQKPCDASSDSPPARGSKPAGRTG